MKHFFLVGIIPCFCLCKNSYAQDIHFSQYSFTPLLINPALTGAINGRHRVSASYKDQWRSVGTPYTTTAFSYDMNFLKEKWPGSYLGGGLVIFNDKAGDAQLGQLQASLSLSSVVSLNDYHKITAGLQGGVAQRSINPSNPALQWDNQFNGEQYDASIVPNEHIPADVFYQPDIGAGVTWSFGNDAKTLSSGDAMRFNVGAAYFHINRPSQKYISSERLNSKLVLHASGLYGMKNTWLSLYPSVLYMRQGALQETNLGLLVRYRVKEESKYTGIFKEMAVYAGSYFRLGDALIPVVMVEFANYSLGITYDVNISALKAATSARGGVEVSLRYINFNPYLHGHGTQKSMRFM